ncbi:MAG: hypothetical protein KGL46_04000 [Hyphomicrobiales bacterium]|nr:hypothetical protein [Hyphomicrobiales bacterium]
MSDAPKQSYVVLAALRHDGVKLGKGDTTDMTADDAEPLVRAGVLAAAPPKASPQEPSPKK